jgi:hypothetical protein
MTLMDLCVIIAVIAVLLFMLWPRSMAQSTTRSTRIQCVNNLKQVGLAYQTWAGDHEDKYPMELPKTNGGTMSFVTGQNAFRHFQVMSNELNIPKLLICPAETDRVREAATNFGLLSNSNLSYFVGVDANEASITVMLSGDHNLTNGTPVKNGVLELIPTKPAGWTAEMHKRVGNVLQPDGSVQQMSPSILREAVAGPRVIITGPQTMVRDPIAFTNHLQMPILNP